MKFLSVAMCGAAILAFGVAKAGERAGDFVVVQPDARIPSTRAVNGYEYIDDSRVLLRVGTNGLYLAELNEGCARGGQFGLSIGVDRRGGGAVDRFSQIVIDGRRCPIVALSEVERRSSGEASAPG